jgi:hypothetical protein
MKRSPPRTRMTLPALSSCSNRPSYSSPSTIHPCADFGSSASEGSVEDGENDDDARRLLAEQVMRENELRMGRQGRRRRRWMRGAEVRAQRSRRSAPRKDEEGGRGEVGSVRRREGRPWRDRVLCSFTMDAGVATPVLKRKPVVCTRWQ